MRFRQIKQLHPLPVAGPADPGAAVVDRLRTILTLVNAQFRDMEHKTGLGGTQIWALNVIATNDSLGVSALAEAMDIHQSTASNILKPLMERGLVAAPRSDDDRRAVQLKLTAKGKRLLAKAPGPFTGVLSSCTAELDPATLKRLDHDLSALVAVMEAGLSKQARGK